MAKPRRLPEDKQCLGIHVPEPLPDCIQLRWDPVHPPVERVKVRAYTCSCRPTFYELCQAGGVLFIRRTRRDGEAIAVEEGGRAVRARAMIVWNQVLEGSAR
jgi:hypothetical protein